MKALWLRLLGLYGTKHFIYAVLKETGKQSYYTWDLSPGGSSLAKPKGFLVSHDGGLVFWPQGLP